MDAPCYAPAVRLQGRRPRCGRRRPLYKHTVGRPPAGRARGCQGQDRSARNGRAAATDEVLNERQFLAQRIFPQTFVAREGLKMPLPSGSRSA
jgi:hypothetical protein